WTSATPAAERVASKAIQMSATRVTDSPNRLTRMPRNSVRTGRRRATPRRPVAEAVTGRPALVTGRGGRSAGGAAHEVAQRAAAAGEPIVEDHGVGPDAEVLDAHLEIGPRLLGVADLGTGLDALRETALEHLELGLLDLGEVPATGLADAHRVVRGT